MTTNETETYYQTALFREAMQNFQAGKWEEGLSVLAEVEKRFPLDVELRTLRQEMQVRARVETYEVEDQQRDSRKKLIFIGTRVALGLLLVLVVWFAAASYYRWVQQRWQTAQADINAQVEAIEANLKYRNAQDLLKVGQADQALQMLEELAATNPELEGLEIYLNDAKTLKEVSQRYAQALELMKGGDQKAALLIFQQIEEERPQYRDVALQIQTLESKVELSDIMQQGDTAYANADWVTAVTAYEAIRMVDSSYEKSHIEAQLFQSYLKAAEDVLDEPEPTLEALQTAESYFSLALSLRPQDSTTLSQRSAVRKSIETRLVNKYLADAEAALTENADSLTALRTAQLYFVKALEIKPDDPTVLLKFRMAQNYLAGIDAFAKNDWDTVILKMEEVVGQDQGYANGTARQALYEALILRGDDYTAAGEYVLALTYYQRAVVLTRMMPEATTTVFEAQTRIAEAQGLMGNYADAVYIYQAALENAGLRSIIYYSDTSLAKDLRSAESYSISNDFRNAFNLYRKIMQDWVMAASSDTYTVQAGDYLPMLARRYNTTVNAILAANGLTAQIQLQPDTLLVIPTTP